MDTEEQIEQLRDTVYRTRRAISILVEELEDARPAGEKRNATASRVCLLRSMRIMLD